MKRVFDIVVTGVALLILWPLFVLVALAVRLDSHGPVIFRQRRVGRGGVEFEILKFRSMSHSTQSGGLVTADGDARVTRVGGFIREFKLDELPQLVNVFVGDMSLVGPRPEVPEYAFVLEDQAEVWSVRPGITDPASIRFRDESRLLAQADDVDEFYRSIILPEKTRMYLEYVRNRSFGGDLLILFRTAVSIFRRQPDDVPTKEG